MSRKINNGIYKIGRVNEDSRSRQGEYFVAKGQAANQRHRTEWKPIQFLDKSKWYVVRVGPTERNTNRTNNVVHPIKEYQRKAEAVEYLMNSIGFDTMY